MRLLEEGQMGGDGRCDDSTQTVDFSTFILSLGTSALYHLGMMADPATGKTQVNLPMARHVIDSLSMLEEKTKGNLDDNEKRLIETLLFDLRLKFVEACKANQEKQS